MRVQVWDVAGAHATRGGIADVYYKDAFGALLVYDLSRPETFESVAKWKAEVDAKVTLPNGEPLPVVLLANKCDRDDARPDRAALPGVGLGRLEPLPVR